MDIKSIDWKSVGLKSLPYVAATTVGIGIGWFTKPGVVKIEEREKIVTVEKKVDVIKNVEVIKYVDVIKYVKVKDTVVQADVHKERTETRLPDGTVTVKETTDTNVKKDTKEDTKKDEIKGRDETKTADKTEVDDTTKTVEREKIVTPELANWHLGILVGAAPDFSAPASTPIVFGVEAERRILGPLFLGVWAMTGTPVVGTPHLTNTAAGLKVGGEF
jgi:hypothetical protein